MAENGSKCLDIAGNEWKWLKIAGNGLTTGIGLNMLDKA